MTATPPPSEPLSPEAAAKVVFERGPLSKAEIKKLNRGQAFEYFEAMSHFLKELGPDEFARRRDDLRAGTFRNILKKPLED